MAGPEFIENCNILSTFDVGSAGGTREDLLDIIVNISPEETTFLSSFPKVPARNIYHEWLLDNLVAPGDPENGNADVQCTPESYDAHFTALTPRCRVGNYTHILRETFDVSETQRAVNNAGMADEYAYQKAKALKELAMHIEFALVHSAWLGAQVAPQAEGVCASPAGCRRMDGLFAIAQWDDTKFECLSADMQGTWLNPGGSPLTCLTPELLDDLSELMYDKGANPKDIYVNAHLKRAISGFYLVGKNGVYPSNDKRLVNVIDVYESDFGLRQVHLHRYMPHHRLLMLDETFARIAVLRPVKSYELAKVGNSDKGMVEGELTLEFRAPAGLGVLDDVENCACQPEACPPNANVDLGEGTPDGR